MEIENIYAVIVISFILTIVASSAIYLLLVEKRFINLAKQLVNRSKIIS